MRSRILSILFLLACFVKGVYGQERPKTITIGKIPSEGLVIDSGWVFNRDDRAGFAQFSLDDRGWQQINPANLVTELPQLQRAGVGWMRLHFRVGDSVALSGMLLTVQQSCASELYLDGQRIATYGRVSADPAMQVVTGVNQTPLLIRPAKGDHVLAVRFSVWPGAFWLRSVNVLMKIWLHTSASYSHEVRSEFTTSFLYIFLASIFLLLGLLHLSFYKYDPSKRANFYFSLYSFLSVMSFGVVGALPTITTMPLMLICYALSFGFILVSAVWLIEALTRLYGYGLRNLRTALWLILAVSLVALLFDSLIRVFGFTLLIFEGVQIWLVAKASRQRRRGAGIIAFAFGFSIACLLSGLVIGIFGLPVSEMAWGLIWVAVFLSPPFGISLYLAREFALDSKSLREKLVEVEQLSARSLAQEQEKQQLLESQNETLELLVGERTHELNRSLENLKATQSQLIQSEKMASLGELTAGIAHEIQNPLNFVNNFSEVSIELLDELKEEAQAGNTADVVAIANDLQQNLEKIGHHGKRADNIVKGMLQHSRAGSGQREPVDINALADEYFRLSYHGLRAKDKTFNAELVTDFDPSLPKLSVVPQDIGRVLLNLFNNAFQATSSRLKSGQDDATYRPAVTVSTNILRDGAEITVKDNGPGIPEAIKDKIFQPFFTTKPTGEGTGLGLSLSYDTVVKGHGGTLEVVSDGQGATFRIWLPAGRGA